MLDVIAALLDSKARIAVAYSGGRDSSALLHATVSCAAAASVEVHALHIQHGLSVHAQDWLLHCECQCRAWSSHGARVSLHARSLALQPARGESIEALARRERYRALAQMAHEAGCDTVLLAHHRDDQVETFLLQALRGAGPAGLSAMPSCVQRDGLAWVRPWLDRPRSAIESYVDAHALEFVEDDSNADLRYARNRLRLTVMPALYQAFADADVTLTSAVQHAQDAQACMQALAEADLRAVGIDDGLDIAALLALGSPRVRNLLRQWLYLRTGRAPEATLLRRLSCELVHARDGSWRHADGVVAAYRQRLSWRRGALLPLAAGRVDADATAASRPPVVASLVPGPNDMPQWSGTLWVDIVEHGGIALAALTNVTLRERCGGERFQSHPAGVPRMLKKQFQAASLPSWARKGPLIYAGEQLIYVPGLGLDARCLAPIGAVQGRLRWQAGDAFEGVPAQV
jgi:tRNA(Ile)-lysidine synthase